MKIFETSEMYWVNVVGVYLPRDRPRLDFAKSFALNFYQICGLATIIYGSLMEYHYEKDSFDVAQNILSFLQTFSNSLLIINYLFYIKRKFRLVELAAKFQRIVDERHNILTTKIYENAEWKTRFVTKGQITFYLIAFVGHFVLSVAIAWIRSITNGEIDVRKWPFLLDLRYDSSLISSLFKT